MPAALVVSGVTYLYMAELDGCYIDDEGEELDMKLPEARRALVKWKRERAELDALNAAAAEREAQGPDDLHVFHVEHAAQMAEYESGKRWCIVSDLAPGVTGSDGVQPGHGVVLQYKDPDGERYRMQYRVSHVAEDLVSLEPGERVRGDGVVFYPKPHHKAWLELVAGVEGMTMERWVRRLCAQQYAISDVRSMGGGGVAGKAGANAELMADLEAGRAARK
jgi:hypothetical protein